MLVLGIHKTLSVQKHYIDIVQLSLLYKIELYLYVHHPMRMANYRFVYGRSLYVHSQGFFSKHLSLPPPTHTCACDQRRL